DSLLSFTGEDIVTASQASFCFIVIGCLFLLVGFLNIASYFYAKRTTFLMTTKDGREYNFLLRGRSSQIDDFRLAVQDAKDLYIEENENRYFDKMRSVLFDQSNYEYALNNARPKQENLSGSKPLNLKSDEKTLLGDSKNKQLPDQKNRLSGTEATMLSDSDTKLLSEADDVLLLDSDGTLLLDIVNPYQLGDGKGDQTQDQSQNLQLKSSPSLADSTLRLKATDLFEKIGFEVSLIEEDEADLLLYRNNFRYIAIVDESGSSITQQHIDKVVYAKDHYKTDFGLLISLGELTNEIKEYADSRHVKIIHIIKTEELNQ
ncbi:MAG: restriction endonuclease, partial [Methanimicrococcus sp.]|nr:restriction endonuclease [Methanimicrococcus sp.]